MGTKFDKKKASEGLRTMSGVASILNPVAQRPGPESEPGPQATESEDMERRKRQPAKRELLFDARGRHENKEWKDVKTLVTSTTYDAAQYEEIQKISYEERLPLKTVIRRLLANGLDIYRSVGFEK